MDGFIILPKRPNRRVGVVRSFSFKLNVGNYQSVDFFCSQKAECRESEAEATSERVYAFCKSQVMKAVREHQAEIGQIPRKPLERETA